LILILENKLIANRTDWIMKRMEARENKKRQFSSFEIIRKNPRWDTGGN
jgi:hypothetical protein